MGSMEVNRKRSWGSHLGRWGKQCVSVEDPKWIWNGGGEEEDGTTLLKIRVILIFIVVG